MKLFDCHSGAMADIRNKNFAGGSDILRRHHLPFCFRLMDKLQQIQSIQKHPDGCFFCVGIYFSPPRVSLVSILNASCMFSMTMCSLPF